MNPEPQIRGQQEALLEEENSEIGLNCVCIKLIAENARKLGLLYLALLLNYHANEILKIIGEEL